MASALPSCEAVLMRSNQELDFSKGDGTADLPSQTIAAVLDGPWLSSCDVPESSAVEVCVAIRAGHVLGVSVATRPADSALNACIKARASALQFPYSSHLDIARTRF